MQQANPTCPGGRKFELARRLRDNGTATSGFVDKCGCALFMLGGEAKGQQVHTIKGSEAESRDHVCNVCYANRPDVSATAAPPSAVVGHKAAPNLSFPPHAASRSASRGWALLASS